MTKATLIARVLKRGAVFFAVFLVLEFAPAGTIYFWQGWALFAATLAPSLVVGAVLFKVETGVLNDLMSALTRGAGFSNVPVVAHVFGAISLVAAGLCRRYSFLMISGWVSFLALLFYLMSFGVLFEAIREDASFESMFKKIAIGDMNNAGLYGMVRHPIHLGVLMFLFMMGLMLGSIVAAALALAYPFIVSDSIASRERVLEHDVIGYKAYKERVKCRVIPKVW